jgi:TolA-binding protein
MRRFALALVILLAVAAQALGDDVSKKHHADKQIAALNGRIDTQKQQEQALRSSVAGYTSRIRALEAKVGDVSLRLSTLQTDLQLHQRRLTALSQLYQLQTRRYRFLQQQYRAAGWRDQVDHVQEFGIGLVQRQHHARKCVLEIGIAAGRARRGGVPAAAEPPGHGDRRLCRRRALAGDDGAPQHARAAHDRAGRDTRDRRAHGADAYGARRAGGRERRSLLAKAVEARRPLQADGGRTGRGIGDRLVDGIERTTGRASAPRRRTTARPRRRRRRRPA